MFNLHIEKRLACGICVWKCVEKNEWQRTSGDGTAYTGDWGWMDGWMDGGGGGIGGSAGHWVMSGLKLTASQCPYGYIHMGQEEIRRYML